MLDISICSLVSDSAEEQCSAVYSGPVLVFCDISTGCVSHEAAVGPESSVLPVQARSRLVKHTPHVGVADRLFHANNNNEVDLWMLW